MNSNVPLYIFDLDGTLSLPDHRRHLVTRPEGPDGKSFVPNWEQFWAASALDAPNYPVIGLLLQLYQIGAEIQIWSGRDECTRAATIQWLFTHASLQPHVADKMLKNMRPHKDTTADSVLKRKWLHTMSAADRRRLSGVFDDRQKVVDMWRAEGITCFQVAPGDF